MHLIISKLKKLKCPTLKSPRVLVRVQRISERKRLFFKLLIVQLILENIELVLSLLTEEDDLEKRLNTEWPAKVALGTDAVLHLNISNQCL